MCFSKTQTHAITEMIRISVQKVSDVYVLAKPKRTPLIIYFFSSIISLEGVWVYIYIYIYRECGLSEIHSGSSAKWEREEITARVYE